MGNQVDFHSRLVKDPVGFFLMETDKPKPRPPAAAPQLSLALKQKLDHGSRLK